MTSQPQLNVENKGTWGEFIRLVIIVILCAGAFRYFIAQPFIVRGESMHPTFNDKQYIIVDQISYNFEEPHRGDVVIFRPPNDPSTHYIKRIIGLPGETIKTSGSDIFIKKNNTDDFIKLDQKNIATSFDKEDEIMLGTDQFFVMGDNRTNSKDSRYFGPITKDAISGRAFLRLFPLSEIDFLPGKFDL